MFFWLQLPEGVDAMALLPLAVKAGVAFVPGAAFFAREPQQNTMRLSFVTLTPEQIERGVALLGETLAEVLDRKPVLAP
jgi:2-aminoadipate transaminase